MKSLFCQQGHVDYLSARDLLRLLTVVVKDVMNEEEEDHPGLSGADELPLILFRNRKDRNCSTWLGSQVGVLLQCSLCACAMLIANRMAAPRTLSHLASVAVDSSSSDMCANSLAGPSPPAGEK